MKIISISGLDGSGKSTQTHLLQEFLKEHGKKVIYFHSIAFSIPQKIKTWKNRYCSICHSKKTSLQEKSVTKANCFQIKLRKLAFLIDVMRFKRFKKKLKKNGYDFLVTDRYFYDTIVNIAYLENKNTPSRIEKYIPKADLALYLKIQPESIMTRDRVPDQGINYLKHKKRLYDMYANLWNFKTIDGSKSRESLHQEIVSLIVKK